MKVFRQRFADGEDLLRPNPFGGLVLHQLLISSTKICSITKLIFLIFGLLLTVQLPDRATGRVARRPPEISIVLNRPDATVRVGEEVAFHITVAGAGDQEFTLCLSNDGYKVIYQGPLKLVGDTAVVKGTLHEPGFLQCRVNMSDGKHWGIAAAAFDPLSIRPSMPKPDDFDEFWRDQKLKLAKIAMGVKLIPDPTVAENKRYSFRSISLANINGSRISGYIAKPAGTGPFPAVLILQNHGGGAWSVPKQWATNFALKGFITLAINAHDIENGREEEYYHKLNEGPLASYTLQGFTDRETYYFKRMYLSIVRSIDYLVSLPVWDRKSMILTGRSQGGGLSLVGAGLDSRVTGVVAAVPALCEQTGGAFGRASGWPRFVPNDEHDYGNFPQYAPAATGHWSPSKDVLNVARYYDAVNFARNIQSPVILGIGLIDLVCPPSTIYSAYNVLQGSKRIIIAPSMGHDADENPQYERDAFVVEMARKAGSEVRISLPSSP